MLPKWMPPWLSLAAVFAAAAATTLNKCCPAGQGLDRDLKSCIPAANAQSLFQNKTLSFKKRDSDKKFNIPCTYEESDALVMNSSDMSFTVNMDTLDLVPDMKNGVGKFTTDEYCLDGAESNNDTLWIAFTCPCERGVCVRTCCSQGKMLQSDEKHKQ